MRSIDIINFVKSHPNNIFKCNIKKCDCPQEIDIFPKQISIEITEYCPLGCKFCMYDSKPNYNIINEFPSLEIMHICTMLNKFICEHVIITGGGEPFYEIINLEYLVSKLISKKITINTSGYWCSSFSKYEPIIVNAFRNYQVNNNNNSAIEIRFSIDRFHQSKVPLDSIIHFIDSFGGYLTSEFNVSFSFRIILLTDNAIDTFFKKYVANVNTTSTNSHLEIELRNGYIAKLYLRPIYFTNKIYNLREEPGFDYATIYEYMSFASSPDGLFRPFLYNNGLNLTIEPTYNISNFSGNTDIVCKYPYNDFKCFISKFINNNIFLAAHRIGLNGLADIACSIDKKLESTLNHTNNYAHLVPLIHSSNYKELILNKAKDYVGN